MKKHLLVRFLSILVLWGIVCSSVFCSGEIQVSAEIPVNARFSSDVPAAAALSSGSGLYREQVSGMADYILRLQCKNGAIRDCAGAKTANTDSNMEYALIGLGAAYQLTGKTKYLTGLKKGIRWLAAAECMTSKSRWKGSWWYEYSLSGRHIIYRDGAGVRDVRGVDTTSALFVYLLYLDKKLDPDSTLAARYRKNAAAALDFISRRNLDSDHLSRSSWQKNASGRWELYDCKYSADQGDVYLGFLAGAKLFHSAQYRRTADRIRKSTEQYLFQAELSRYCVSIEDGQPDLRLDSFDPIQSQGFLPWVWGSDGVNEKACSWLSGKLSSDGSVRCYPGDPGYAMSIALLCMAERAAGKALPAASCEWLLTHLYDEQTGGMQDSTVSAEEDCNVAGFCIIALTGMRPFE